MSAPVSRKKIIVSIIAAIGVATLLLIAIILPAEYGYDPLGTGKKLNLLALTQTSVSALELRDQPLHDDTISFVLHPFESLEYKYHLDEGATLVYHWQSSADIAYDMHADPDKGEGVSEETFAKGKGSNKKGVYRAVFSGLHGWWWENRGSTAVTIQLKSSGFYSFAKEMKHNFDKRYSFDDK